MNVKSIDSYLNLISKNDNNIGDKTQFQRYYSNFAELKTKIKDKRAEAAAHDQASNKSGNSLVDMAEDIKINEIFQNSQINMNTLRSKLGNSFSKLNTNTPISNI